MNPFSNLLFATISLLFTGTFHPKISDFNTKNKSEVGQSVKNQHELTPNYFNCEIADICSEITATQTLQTTPTDLLCGAYIINNIESCLTGASPEAESYSCDTESYPTVWLKIETDQFAVQLNTIIQTSGSWQPVWSIYTRSCDNLLPLQGGTRFQPVTCSSENSNPNFLNVAIPLAPNGEKYQTFFVAVSGVGIIDNPNFTLTAYTTAGCSVGLGNDACTPDATFTIIERSSNRSLDDPEFNQGEEVRLCIDFYYHPNSAGDDWFHGLIPDFGDGWDMDYFDPYNVEVSPVGAFWLSTADGACAPLVTETMPLLCSYYDDSGILKLCNIKCGVCPCSPPLVAGSPLPSGWFWNTNGGEGCENSCNPSTRYGVPGSHNGLNIEICMDLRTKTFENEIECSQKNNLQISFQTTSDGVSGCWNDPVAECRLDVTQKGPLWTLNCDTLPGINFDNVLLKDNIFLTSYFSTKDGSDRSIMIDPLQNPAVRGMKSHVLPNGFGYITDTLLNFTRDTIMAEYLVWLFDSTGKSEIVYDTFRVELRPFTNYTANTISVCPDSCTWLRAGTLDDTLIQNVFWKNGSTLLSIKACVSDNDKYDVIIRDINNQFYQMQYHILEVGKPGGVLLANIPICGDTLVQLFVDAFDTTLANMNYQLFLCSDSTEILLKADSLPFLYTFKLKNDKEEYCFAVSVTSEECIAPKTEVIITNPNYIIGKPCDDNDPNTINDVYNEDCICRGEFDNSVSLTDKSGTIKIYPNPASDYVDVVFDKEENDVEIFLISSVGQPLLLESFDILNGKKISVRDLPVGIYFLKIKHQNKYLYMKVLKV